MSTFKKKKIRAAQFDHAFEQGNAAAYLDLKTARAHHPVQRINIDMPQEILMKVDEEASRIGVARTSLLKLWIAERIERLAG